MMSLVDYGGSSSEEESNPDEETPVQPVENSNTEVESRPPSTTAAASPQSNFQCENDEVEENLKMRVPGNLKLEDIIKSKPKKKKKGKILINMPTFSDDSDSDTETKKMKKRLPAGSRKGLTALLPAPKAMIVREGNRPMIPYSLSRKPPPTKAIPKATAAKPSVPKDEVGEKVAEDVAEPKLKSFFALDDDDELPEVKMPSPPPAPAAILKDEEISQVQIGPQRPTPEELPPQPSLTISFDNTAALPTDFIPQAELRIQRKRKRDEPIDIIDVRQDELTAGVEIELTKGVSQEEDEYKKLKSDQLPSRLAASKHQITWLAHKAKEQEFELKNSWATAKFNKMQTRNKYGF